MGRNRIETVETIRNTSYTLVKSGAHALKELPDVIVNTPPGRVFIGTGVVATRLSEGVMDNWRNILWFGIGSIFAVSGFIQGLNDRKKSKQYEKNMKEIAGVVSRISEEGDDFVMSEETYNTLKQIVSPTEKKK